MMVLRPYKFFEKVEDITPQFLKKEGIKGLLLDVDNTLCDWHTLQFAEETLQWIEILKKEKFKILLVSNNSRNYLERVSGLLSLNYLPGARKPFPSTYKRALEKLELPKEAVGAVGDQLFTDVLGANLAGIKSFLVKPRGKRGFLLTKLISRPLESAVKFLFLKDLFEK